MALDPEKKMQIIAELQKRSDITPEQHQLLGRMWMSQLAKQDRPVQPTSVISDAIKGGNQGIRAIGTLAATQDLNEATQVAQGEEAETTAGKVGSFAGDLISPGSLAVGGAIGAVGKGLTPVAKAGLNKAGQMIETLKGPTLEEAKALRQVAEAGFRPETTIKAEQFSKNLIDPVKAEVDSIASRLAQLPGKTADKLKILQEKLGLAGKEMGAAEEAAGFGFKSTPEFEAAIKSPEVMQKTLRVAENFVKRGPEKIAETIDAKTIQQTRKLIQEGSKEKTLSDLGTATMQQGREVAAKALGILDKRFDVARKQYQEIADAIKAVETDSPRMAQQLKAQLKDAKMKLASLQTDAKDLLTSAKAADKARLLDIKRQSLDLIRQGVEHDRLVRNIKTTVMGLGGAGAAALGLKKAL